MARLASLLSHPGTVQAPSCVPVYSASRFSEAGAKKIQGYIEAKTITVLIDCGVAHNFIVEDLCF